MLVLASHACQTHGFPSIRFLKPFLLRGNVGVEVFFVISGFLITSLLLREQQSTRRIGIRAFYARRILRIFPAYVCFVGVVALLDYAGQAHLMRRDWIAVLTYTVNFIHAPTWQIGHFWSLSIEEHFYLIWPLLIAAGGLIGGRRAALVFIILCFILRWVVLLFAPRYTQMAELWTFTRLDTIAFGCLLALNARDEKWRSALTRLSARDSIVCLALGGLLSSIILSSVSAKFQVGIAYTVNSALIAFLIWCAIDRSSSRIGSFLNNRIVGWVGVGSYSLYLWQQIFLNPHENGFANRFPQNLAFACIAGVLSYFLVEKPFLSLKKRLVRTRTSHGRGAELAIWGATRIAQGPGSLTVVGVDR